MRENGNYEKRLLKLAEHLATEKLQWVNIDSFSVPQVNVPKPVTKVGPGVVEICTYFWAMMQLPYLWPQHFGFHPTTDKVVARNGLDVLEAVMEFFNLTADEMFHIWVPTEQQPELYGGRVLDYNARPSDLAELIIQFVSRKMTLQNGTNVKSKQS
jgi:hypothetical protein